MRDFMDLELIKIVRNGDVNGLKQLQERDPNILHQVTPVGNTLLHLAAKFGHQDFLVEVCDRCPSLITKINRYGDTALHVGARTQNKLVVIQYLIDRIASSSSDSFRSQNHKGDSALHEALRYCRPDVAKLLIQTDPHLCLLVNKASESPIFLAVTKGYDDVVFQVLNYSPSAPCDGPKGWTALHACAMSKKKGLVGSYMMEKLLQVKPELGRVVDIYGRTPLHYAVNACNASIVALLLERDSSLAYVLDRDGWSPLHVAAYWSAYFVAEKIILETIIENIIHYCPDFEYLVDNRGNNVLHILIETWKRMEHVGTGHLSFPWLLFKKFVKLEELLNQPNNDGDTPLHLATLYGLEDFVEILAKNARIDKKARNGNNLTASDIAGYKFQLSLTRKEGVNVDLMWSKISSRVSPNDHDHLLQSSGPLLWIDTLNPHFGLITEEYAKRLNVETQEAYQKRIKEEQEARRKLSETHMLVATLIATVAFAAAFQMPGGYESGGDDDNKKKGMAVLAGEAAFKAFVISDVVAFSCSVLTLLLYFLAEISIYINSRENIGPSTNSAIVSGSLIYVAIVAMTLAFMSGVFVVLVRTHSLWIGIVTVLVCISVPLLPLFYSLILEFIIFLTRDSEDSEDSDDD